MQTKANFRPALAWTVVLTASLFFFYEFIQMNLFNPIHDSLKQAFNLNAAELGWLGSMYFFANALFLFPAGILLDRFPTKKLLLTAVICCTAGTFIFALAEHYWLAAAARFLVGLGAAFCFLSCIRLASRWFPPNRMALVTGVVITIAMSGGLVAQTPLALLSNWLGWRHAVLVDGCVGIFVAIAIAYIVQDWPPNSQANAAVGKARLQTLGFWRSIKLVLLNPQNWYGGLYTSLMNLPIFLLGALWGIPYLQQVHQLTHVQATYATDALFLGVIVGSPLYGWISDHIGRRVLPMMVGAMVSVAVILILMYLPNVTLFLLVLLFFLLGFFTSSQVLSYPTIAELNPIVLTSTAVSVDSTTIMLSGVLCEPFFGWILESNWDHTIVNGVSIYTRQDFNHAMWMMPVAFGIALVISFLIRETYCKSQA